MMNRILLLLVICVALAALKAFALLIVALLALAVVVAFIMHPRCTVVFVVALALSALTVSQPVPCIVAIGVVGVVVSVSARLRRRSFRRYLTPPR